MSAATFALAVHGGAGAVPGVDYTEQRAHLGQLLADGAALLESGGDAVEVSIAMVRDMEASGLYVAGRGSAPNQAGEVELDASVMDGHTGRAGSVAAIKGFVHPVEIAALVMEKTDHVMLAGEGAEAFARHERSPRVDSPETYYLGSSHVAAASTGASSHGTVGAVARDLAGHLAAATSTGGIFGKMQGRVGDTPLIGAGSWADEDVAISCTGYGEAFILAGGAGDIAARIRYQRQPLREACDGLLDRVARLGGNGGVIAIDRNGRIATPFNSDGMKCGYVTSASAPVVGVFEALD